MSASHFVAQARMIRPQQPKLHTHEMVWFNFLLWFLSTNSLFSSSSGEDFLEPLVTYLSFSSENLIFPSFNINDTQRLNATVADDTPLLPLQLHQVFPYFGQYFDKIYVSPNGFIQMTPNPECGAYYCDPCTAKYYGSIGGIVDDLAPFKSVNASISSIQSNSSTIIIYSKVPILVNSTYNLSFKIAILNEGTVLISYDEVPNYLYTTSKFCSWFSGLVAPRNHSAILSATSPTAWNRTVPGVYPPSRSATESGNIFIACPISTTWCISPSILSTVSFPQSLNLTTLSMSCYDPTGSSYVNWAITLSVAPSIYHPCEVNFLSSEGYPTGMSPAKLRCDLNPDWESLIGSATSASVSIFWTLDSTTYHPLDEVNPLTIQLSSTEPSQNCSLNSLSPLGSCSSCQVCEGMISSCSQTRCDADHSSQSTVSVFPPYEYPYDSLYIQPSCSTYETDTCKHAFDLMTDTNNKCCDVDSIDCMGICNGNSQPGYQNNALICCEGHVDCAGICGGKSYVDACGVCGGTDTGQKCPTYVEITTNSISSNQLLAQYNHINQTDNSHTITIQNDGNSSIYVKFSIRKHDSSYDPWVVIPVGVYNITNKTSQTFVISSNITRIYSKVSPSWEVKTILIE
jgi:hypothetical protein